MKLAHGRGDLGRGAVALLRLAPIALLACHAVEAALGDGNGDRLGGIDHIGVGWIRPAREVLGAVKPTRVETGGLGEWLLGEQWREAKPYYDAAKLKEALKDTAQDVRVTSRLEDSPACLVVSEGGMSMQLARLLKQAGQKAPEVKPVLEVNASHPLVQKLDGSPNFHDLAHILFDQALLAEGGMPEDPAAYVKRVNALLA